MPADLVMVKKIVIMDMGEQIGKLKKLDEVYKTYSYCLKTLNSYEFEFDCGVGFAKMQSIMQAFRGGYQWIQWQEGREVAELRFGVEWSAKVRCAQVLVGR